MHKKFSSYKINFVQPSTFREIEANMLLAKEQRMTAACLSFNMVNPIELEAIRKEAKRLSAKYDYPVIVGLLYRFRDFTFTIFGENAIDHLCGRHYTEEELVLAKSLYKCSVILHEISEKPILDLEFNFSYKIIDAYEKYHNGKDSEFITPLMDSIRLSRLKFSSPISCSECCTTGYSMIRKPIKSDKDLVAYLAEHRPVSMFAEFMLQYI